MLWFYALTSTLSVFIQVLWQCIDARKPSSDTELACVGLMWLKCKTQLHWV